MPDEGEHGEIVKLRNVSGKGIYCFVNSFNQEFRIERRNAVQRFDSPVKPELLVFSVDGFRKPVSINKQSCFRRKREGLIPVSSSI